MTHTLKIGDRVIVRGTMVDVGQLCSRIKTAGSTAPVVHYNKDVEIDPTPAPHKFDEVERVARIMCDATYGAGMAGCLVNRWQMQVVGRAGAVGHRFIIPPPDELMPLWREFEAAALALIEDHAK